MVRINVDRIIREDIDLSNPYKSFHPIEAYINTWN